MKRIKSFLGIAAFSLVVLALPSVASAQWGGGYPGNGGYGNGGYGNGGYYGGNARGAVQNLKQQARSFEQITNRAENRQDDRGGWGNGNWGRNNGRSGDLGRLEDLADNFRKAADKLEKKFGNGRNLNNSRDEAGRVLSLGSQIDNEMYRTRDRNLQNYWGSIRRNLDVIANVYGFGGGYNDRYPANNRNRNGNRNGDWRNRVPFPLPF